MKRIHAFWSGFLRDKIYLLIPQNFWSVNQIRVNYIFWNCKSIGVFPQKKRKKSRFHKPICFNLITPLTYLFILFPVSFILSPTQSLSHRPFLSCRCAVLSSSLFSAPLTSPSLMVVSPCHKINKCCSDRQPEREREKNLRGKYSVGELWGYSFLQTIPWTRSVNYEPCSSIQRCLFVSCHTLKQSIAL